MAGKNEDINTNLLSVASAQELWNRDNKEFERWALSLIGAKLKQYGTGVIGILGFIESGKKKQKIIVQAKGVKSLLPCMISDLLEIVEKEGAVIGLIISLSKPTLSMITESVHAGSYESELWKRKFLKIQIRTIAELLEGKSFDIPQTYGLIKKKSQIKEKGETARLF